MPRQKPEKMDPVDILGFSLVNVNKVNIAMVNLTKRLGDNFKEEDVLTEYDKLGGLIRKGARIIAIGTFYDFLNKVPKKIEDYDKIDEEDFEDEYVLQRKKKETPSRIDHAELIARIKRLKKKEIDPDEEEKPKRGRPKKEELE